MPSQAPHESKAKLLNAALNVIRAKGYSATTVDDICHAAGVTKGSFFHHFKNKDDLALSAAAYWGDTTEGFFAAAPYHQSKVPLERLLGYVDFRAEILQGICRTTPVYSAPWFKKPTRRIPIFAQPATRACQRTSTF